MCDAQALGATMAQGLNTTLSNRRLRFHLSIGVVSQHSNIGAVDDDLDPKGFCIETVHCVEVGVVFPTSASVAHNSSASLAF